MDVRNKRVLVTGGAGFIGSHLVEALLVRGNDVVAFDDYSSGSPVHLAHLGGTGGLRLVEGDVRDLSALDRAMRGVDCVFHLATRNVRLSLVQPSVVHEVNTTGTLNVLKAAVAAGAQRLLYCSSSEVNGTADIVPMPEDYAFRPETIYGASKLAGEYYAQVFHRSGWLPTVVARPHNNYGPREHFAGQKGEVIPRFILWALAGQPLRIYGSGRQTRDFTFVEETAGCLVRLMECDAALGDTVNVCRGEEVSILELAQHVRELTGRASEIVHLPGRPSDVLRLFGDPSRLGRLLGSTPSVSVVDGLRRTVEWFRQNVPLSAEVLASLEVATWASHAPEPWMRRHPGRAA